MLIDLVFRNVTFSQGKVLLDAAVAAGVNLDAVDAGGAPAPKVAAAAPAASGTASTTSPASIATPPKTAPAATADRVPGEDDGPPANPADEKFYRCGTVKAVVKLIVEEEKVTDQAAVVARVRSLKAAGIAALEAVPAEALEDRIVGCLAALGL